MFDKETLLDFEVELASLDLGDLGRLGLDLEVTRDWVQETHRCEI